MTGATRAPSGASILADMAVWPAAYAVAAMLCWRIVAEGATGLDDSSMRRAAIVGCTAAAAFLVDRVKLRDAWLDPADREADPARFAFIARHARVLRWSVAALIAAASAIALSDASVHAQERMLLASVPWLAVAGTVAYAPWPRTGRPRLKDLLGVKNLAVGAAITALAVVAGREGLFAPVDRATLLVMAALVLRGTADAALCDFDDAAADRAHGTRTFVASFGRPRALAVTGCARAASAALLVVAHAPIVAALGIASFACSAVFARGRRRVGRIVDAALLLECTVYAFTARGSI